MTYPYELTPLHLDLLKEIGNIGAGNAATSLSKLLNRKINMKVPDVKIISFDEMMEVVGGPEQVIASVFVRIQGDATGSIFFVLSPEEASKFVGEMIGDESFQFGEPPFSELGLSAYTELGNILSGSYLSALSDFTQLNLQPSVPSISVDMVGAILTFGLIELSQVADHAILIDTILQDEKYHLEKVRGHFFLLPDPDSFQTFFQSLGVSSNE
ncbi:chemotaxis protein CheC [Salirhabdus euzebyi]|uniref:Chemotaxis protein CheC n=1 Tax=Salirhabdus euzebyi TaxID=394506 RepID=A0A841Q3D2_9BACI|nr:chemotaxis protein CheC [Salirhabdus euzebyi]MBB6452901.1 chemotaxis protein CheC [Salirhabdus euzebyi]